MKIAVFGATGGTGQQVVRQACEAGHDVTAVVRSAARLTESHPNLAVFEEDVMDPSAIGSAVAGQDAVVSSIGARDVRRPTTVCTDSVTSIIEAMRAHGVRRLVVVSNSGMHAGNGDGPWMRMIFKPIVQRVLRHPFADMRAMEEVVFSSGVDWTVLRPPRLTTGPRTGVYRSAVNRNVPGLTVSRADLADCVLRCLGDPESARSAISVAN
jgi:putative NADH-flavin reductase